MVQATSRSAQSSRHTALDLRDGEQPTSMPRMEPVVGSMQWSPREGLAPVVNALPPCQIRRTCRWIRDGLVLSELSRDRIVCLPGVLPPSPGLIR
jgi:hypothetical protein